MRSSALVSPDLTTSASAVGSTNLTAGQSNVQSQVTVSRSGGSLPVDPNFPYVDDRLYFSSNSTWDSGDTLLWTSNGSTPDYPVSTLNSNGSKTVTATYNIPNVGTGGTYYIISVVDGVPSPNGYYAESNESNNTYAYSVAVSVPVTSPDLTTSASAVGSTNLTAGQSNVQSQVTVSRSGGSLPVDPNFPYVDDRLYFSSNSTWDSGDTLLWTSNGSTPDYPVSTLNSNGSKTVTATYNIPNVGTGGTYYIISVVDGVPSPNGYYAESNESNNTYAYSVAVSVPVTSPDLTTSASAVGSTNLTAGQSNVQSQVTVSRSGGSLPVDPNFPYVDDRLYFSSNSTWDSGDTLLWTSNGSTPDYPVSTLNSNGSKTVTATYNIPNVGTGGTYYIISVVDGVPSPNGYYAESNESNNTYAYSVAVSVPVTSPDLTTSASAVGSTNLTAGQSNVQSQVTVSRSGGSLPVDPNFPYVDDRLYFSSNSTWDSGDTLLWTSNGSTPDYPVSTLNSNGSKTVTATYNIPNVGTGGTYYIISVVDGVPSPNGYYAESNESNNTFAYSITVQGGSGGPTIASTPASGPQVTTNFLTTGSGFTPNGQIRQFLTFPNQSNPQEISQIKADGQGKFSYTYTTKCSDNPGVYTLYMVDVTSNGQSNQVTQTVNASATCNAPTLTLNPATGPQGTTFQITGSGYTHNGQVRRFTVFPNGVTYELPGTTASSTGQIAIVVPTDCGTVVGSYTTYMLDVGTNTESLRAGDQVTAGASCSSTTALFVAPESAPLGTGLTFTGSGFSHNSTATLSVTRGDGQPGNGSQYNTDSNGGVSFVISSQPGDPLGQWTFRLTDANGNHASKTVQYTDVQQSGTDLMYYTASTIDVTIPDNTQFIAGQIQNKVWRIQNSGTNGWTNYHLVYVSGNVNGNTSSNLSSVSSLTINANPGQWINTPNLPITAPSAAGTYYSYWQMQNSSGQNFGTRIYVKIRVVPKQGTALGFGSQSGRSGSNDSPSAKSGRNADPVDTATGNYNYTATDLRMPGRGLDVELARSYNSQDSTVGPLGQGWSHGFNIYLFNITSTSASVHYSDGKVLDYINQTGTSNFISSYPGYYDTLVQNGNGTWTLKKTDQRNYQFDASGRLTAIQDRNNNQLSLSYSGSNLTQITDTVGRLFTFAYSGSRLTSITDAGGRNLQFSYDANSRLISFRDARGNTNTYSYDGSNRLLRIVDGRGNNLVVNTYDSSNRVATQANGRGNQWTFVYDADGSTSVFDPLSKETRYVQDTNFNLQQTFDRNAGAVTMRYDESNNRAQTADPNGNYAAYVYDQNGNIISRSDPTLNSRQVIYDSKNNPTRLIDEMGKTTQITYDGNGNLTMLTDALTNSSSTTHDSFGEPISITDPGGNVTTQTYDGQGNLTSVKDALNNTTTYTYDGLGRRTSVTDARGKTSSYTYDANDNVLTVTDPLNNVTTYTYDANNNRISMRDPRGNTTTYAYDENNSLIKETDPKGNFIQHTYDKLDRRTSTRDKRGNITSFNYDNEGRLLAVTDPLGNTTSYTYDANGNRTKITDSKGQSTTFSYDALNRLTKIQDAIGNTIQKEYDATSRLKKETDPRGNTTQFTYDAVGNLTQANDAASGTVKYSYDKNRNRITQSDPNNHTSNLAYDKLNRLISSSDPLGHASSSTYDEVGNRTNQTDAKGQTTKYAYDSANRLSVITYPDNSTVQFTRDGNGNITRMVDSLGTSNYVYDELNRLTSYTDPFGKTIGYQYDENGNITKLTYPDGKQVSYQFDADNRMTLLSDWAGKATSFQYDSTNLLTTVTYPNGIVSSIGYDNAGRLTAKSDSGISSYSFTLDKSGNRTSANITQPLGNRLQNIAQTYSHDAANQIQSAGNTTFAFDNNGNMTSKNEGGVITNYGYDFENRLVSVSGSSQYFYDGQGVRLLKIEGTKTTRYVVDSNHDLSQVLSETDANGAITAYYVYGLGLAYMVKPDGTHYYYSFDPLGSTIAMTDDAKSVVNSYAYDAFGKVTNKVENSANAFQFIGEYGVMQESNGLVFMRARYYQSNIGRFLNKDRALGRETSTQDLNLFPYANNDSVNLVDPSGLLFERVGRFVKRVFHETVEVAKTVPAFVACAGTGGRTPGLCERAGYGPVGQAVLQFSSKTTAAIFLGPQAAYALEGYDTAYDAGTYAEAAIRLARGELSIDEALRIARDAALKIPGGAIGILSPLLDKLDDLAVSDAYRRQIADIRAQRGIQSGTPRPQTNSIGKPQKQY